MSHLSYVTGSGYTKQVPTSADSKCNDFFSDLPQTSEKGSLKTKQLVPSAALRVFIRASLQYKLMGLSTGITTCIEQQQGSACLPQATCFEKKSILIHVCNFSIIYILNAVCETG